MKKKILNVASIVLGLMFVNAGLNKFFNYMPVPDDLPQQLIQAMEAITEIGWLLPLIAVAEIVGGVLVIIKRFRALGAIVIFPVMIGIILTHVVQAPSGMPLALVLLGINLWIISENREKYLPMIADSSITSHQ